MSVALSTGSDTSSASINLNKKMASATGIPEEPPREGRGEDEPLLGRAGDASQQEGKGIQFNFFIGKSFDFVHRRTPLTL